MKTDLVKAVELLRVGDLNGAHEIAQKSEDVDSNYVHAIMHRREGDYGNSLYWYQRVGKHPVLAAMEERYPQWNLKDYLRKCEENDNVDMQDEELRLLEAHIAEKNGSV